MIDPVLAGLVTGLSLIIAIGAQNAYVLRQGLVREHVGVVVAICALSDVALIVAGVIVVKLGERPPASRRRRTISSAGRPVQAVHEH